MDDGDMDWYSRMSNLTSSKPNSLAAHQLTEGAAYKQLQGLNSLLWALRLFLILSTLGIRGPSQEDNAKNWKYRCLKQMEVSLYLFDN